jgi:uncharacterized membrane protein YbhN (UPF0104 family)
MRTRLAARFALGLAILVLVLLAMDPAEVARALAGAELRLVAIGIIGLTAMHAVAASGWRWMIAQRSGLRLPWGTALRVHYAAQALGSVTPGNLGSDFHRATVVRQAGHGWSAAIEPIVVQRATSYLALSLLAGIGLVVVSTADELSRLIVLIGAGVAGLLMVISWQLLRPIGPFRGVHAWLRDRLGGAAGEPSGGPDTVALHTWPILLIGLGTGLTFHAGSVALTWVLVAALDPQTPVWPVLGAIAIARLSLAVPLTPNGLGVQEGTLAALLTAMQLSAQPALAAMLLARLSTVLLAAIGVALMVRGPRVQPLASGYPDQAAKVERA